jgi:hypothetical protein
MRHSLKNPLSQLAIGNVSSLIIVLHIKLLFYGLQERISPHLPPPILRSNSLLITLHANLLLVFLLMNNLEFLAARGEFTVWAVG